MVEHTKKPQGEFLELLGSYNPHQKEFKVKKERVEYWMSKGAQISATVNNLMVNYKVWDKPKMPSWKPKKKSAKETPAKAAPAKEEADSAPAEVPAAEPSPIEASVAEEAPAQNEN